MEVKPVPGLEHLPFAEVWFDAIDAHSAARQRVTPAADARAERASRLSTSLRRARAARSRRRAGRRSTPNGIRTRAAGVKGRSPRPLDDGGAARRVPLPTGSLALNHSPVQALSPSALAWLLPPICSSRVLVGEVRSGARAANYQVTAGGWSLTFVVGARCSRAPTQRSHPGIAETARCPKTR